MRKGFSNVMEWRVCRCVRELGWSGFRHLMLSHSVRRKTAYHEGQESRASQGTAHQSRRTWETELHQTSSEDGDGQCEVLMTSRWYLGYHKTPSKEPIQEGSRDAKALVHMNNSSTQCDRTIANTASTLGKIYESDERASQQLKIESYST